MIATGTMRNRKRLATLCTLGIVLALGLSACTFLFSNPPVPTLILGEVIALGGCGELLLSVTNMPDGGMASISIVVGGIAYDAAKIANLTAVGLQGFEVLAEQFVGGNGGLSAAHSCAGLPAGKFVLLRFDATGDVTLTDFTFDKTKIALGDDDNQAITFDLTTAVDYYTD